jgi:hypothetical protein
MVAPRAGLETGHLESLLGWRRWGGARMRVSSTICVDISHTLGLEDVLSDLLDSEISNMAVGEETFDRIRVGFGKGNEEDSGELVIAEFIAVHRAAERGMVSLLIWSSRVPSSANLVRTSGPK